MIIEPVAPQTQKSEVLLTPSEQYRHPSRPELAGRILEGGEATQVRVEEAMGKMLRLGTASLP